MVLGERLAVSVHRFLDTTTARGVPRTVRSPSKPLKLIWTASVIGLLFWGSYQVYVLISSYLEYPTITKLQYVNEGINGRTFPAITLCNLNPFPSYSPNIPNEPPEEYYHRVMTTLSKYNLDHEIYSNLFTSTFLSDTGYFQSMKPEIARKVGHDAFTFIVECNLFDLDDGVRSCRTEDQISIFQHSDFFNCFTISTNSTSVMYMDIVLFLDNFDGYLHEYYNPFRYSREKRGVRMSVHEAGKFPPLDENMIQFSPGHSVDVAVDKDVYERLPAPHGACRDANSGSGAWDYSWLLCGMLCANEAVRWAHGCNLVPYCMADEDHSLPYCHEEKHVFRDVSNSTIHDYINRIVQPYVTSMGALRNQSICDCRMPCTETDFHSMVSLTTWPWKSHLVAFYNRYIMDKPYAKRFNVYEDIKETMKINMSKAKEDLGKIHLIEDNFVHLKIHYRNTLVTTIKTSAKQDMASLLSSIGGALNFYCGITVILLVELLELFINAFVGIPSDEKKEKPNSVNPLRDRHSEIPSAWIKH